MERIGEFPVLRVHYGRDGRPKNASHREDLHAFVEQEQLDDLLVMSHGWNNTEAEAMEHYRELGARLGTQRESVPGLSGRKIGLMLIVWPSKAIAVFDKDEPGMAQGAASATPETAEVVDPNADLDALIAELELDGDAGASLRSAAAAAISDEAGFEAFIVALRAALPVDTGVGSGEDALEAPEEADRALLIDGDPRQMQLALRRIVRPADGADWEAGQGGAAGGVAQGAAGAVGGAVNISTFYLMKRRAGLVGNRGVARTLGGLREVQPQLRIHLYGHSFGARLQTMATLAMRGDPQARPNSLFLAQAAFSHNGFSGTFPPPDGGFFRDVIAMGYVDGPIVVTHTLNDWPVRVAYSVASALVREAAAFTSSGPSRYGGLGANGTQHTTEGLPGTMQTPGDAYAFSGGQIFNLESSAFISGHSDVRNDGVAFAVCSAMSG